MIKISRSGVEKYLECQRCFVLQYKHKIRPPSLPFTLNSAVDNLCKNEFDYYRKRKEPHPLFLEHNIDAIPFDHTDINNWEKKFRTSNNFTDFEKRLVERLHSKKYLVAKIGASVQPRTSIVEFARSPCTPLRIVLQM